jgi:hypothetical protein
LELRESANKRREARFVILAIQPCSVPSLGIHLHGKIKETGTRAGLETHTSNELLASGARPILQKEIVLEQGTVRRNSMKSFVEMDKYGDL